MSELGYRKACLALDRLFSFSFVKMGLKTAFQPCRGSTSDNVVFLGLHRLSLAESHDH